MYRTTNGGGRAYERYSSVLRTDRRVPAGDRFLTCSFAGNALNEALQRGTVLDGQDARFQRSDILRAGKDVGFFIDGGVAFQRSLERQIGGDDALLGYQRAFFLDGQRPADFERKCRGSRLVIFSSVTRTVVLQLRHTTDWADAETSCAPAQFGQQIVRGPEWFVRPNKASMKSFLSAE